MTDETALTTRTSNIGAPSLSTFLNASRLRTDTWNELKTVTVQLAEGGKSAAATKRLRQAAATALSSLEPIESYWAFPGREAFRQLRVLYERLDHSELAVVTARIVRALTAQSYRRRSIALQSSDSWDDEADRKERAEAIQPGGDASRPYFEVLVVDSLTSEEQAAVRSGLQAMRRSEDRFIYDVVVVPSFEDAVIAVLFNFNIQAVVVRYGFPFRSAHRLEVLQQYLGAISEQGVDDSLPGERGSLLGAALQRLRPELDLYLVTDVSVEELASRDSELFRRIFYRQEDYLELHLSLVRGIGERYQTPFFSALKEYAQQPTGVFHAMPISRGKSVVKSNWIRDMVQFYGLNIFLAETSATSGGLDSLLEPRSTIKQAQENAARAFGARRSFFVTNGTSTANKIVVQALIRPGDIVLVDRDCHKSHHYTLVLAGAQVIYLDSYPLHDYSFYGAVPLSSMVQALRELEADGKLDRVRMVLLTNCTFDGVVYHPERVMQELLAIKPDLVFVWDEAWFAFARASPLYRQRTAMDSARRLRDRFRSKEYAAAYAAAEDKSGLPDPARVRVRAYATQSTHKTLTSLRQGSMIHVWDQDWATVEHSFRDAFMTHTSTSPNYQILASLDLGRRQLELEGYELVQKQVELALILREKVAENPLLTKWFSFLTIRDLIPAEYRASKLESYYDIEAGWSPMTSAWEDDEFVLDPSRLTLYIGKTGIDGDTFKTEILMDRYGIQINKTSRNTVLFMTNIGTTRSSVAHLLEVLTRIASRLEEEAEDAGPARRRVLGAAVASLTENLPPLPDFSHFHEAFRPDPTGSTPEGDLRRAFFLAADEEKCEYLKLDAEIDQAMDSGREVVAATFLTPYPPGFPILVPGQVVSHDIVAYVRALDTKEIHGYEPEYGFRVFTAAALDAEASKHAAGGR